MQQAELGAGLKFTEENNTDLGEFKNLTPEILEQQTGTPGPTFHPEPGQRPQLQSEVQQFEDPNERAREEDSFQFLQDFWEETGDSDAGNVLELFFNAAIGIPEYGGQKAKEYARETQGTDAHLTTAEIAGFTAAVVPLLKKAPQLLPHLQKLGVGFPALQHTLKQVVPTLDEAAEFAMDVFNPLADLKPALTVVNGGVYFSRAKPPTLQGPLPVPGPGGGLLRTPRGISIRGPKGEVIKNVDPLATQVETYRLLGGDISELSNRAKKQAYATPDESTLAKYMKRYGISREVAAQSHHILEHALYGEAVSRMKNPTKALKAMENAGFLPGNTAWQMLDVPGGVKGSSHQGWFHSKELNALPAKGDLVRKLKDGSFEKMNFKDQMDLLTRSASEAEAVAKFWMRWKDSKILEVATPEFLALRNALNKNPDPNNARRLRQYVIDNPDWIKEGTGEQPTVQQVMNAIYKKGRPIANPQLKGGLFTSAAQRALFQTEIGTQAAGRGLARRLPLNQ